MKRDFLVVLHGDPIIRLQVTRPMVIETVDGFATIKKNEVVCDACNSIVALDEDELENYPAGYAVCDEDYLYEVVCDNCRKKYFGSLPVYKNFKEAIAENRW